MNTWIIIYKHNGVSKWQPIKAAHTMQAKDLFFIQHEGDYCQIIDVEDYKQFNYPKLDVNRFRRILTNMV